MSDTGPARIFHGSELPRLLILFAIMVVGWAWVWNSLRAPVEPIEPEPIAERKPPAVEPDASPEFETVGDKTVLAFRDMSAYAKLLDQARDSTAADLAAHARRDVTYAHLWERPGHYRGVPVHLLGVARRVLRYESKQSRTGWLHEAWVFTADGQNNPYVCVFEDVPKGLPIGPNVSERVVFNGYFLKLMRYEAGDVPRAAPLLVGRIGWTPRPGGTEGSSQRTAYWLAGAVGVMFLISLGRWILQLRRSLAPKSLASRLRDRPTEEIAPEDLNEWLESVASEPEKETPPKV